MNPSSNNLYASIDIGTNSFKMIIVQADPSSGKFITIHHSKHQICLGQDTSSSISTDSTLKALETLKTFTSIIKSHSISIDNTFCVATSAVREAENRIQFKGAVFECTGLKVSVLSGEEEGKYVYLAAIQFLPVFSKRILVVDIGGGSTEFVVGERGNVLFCVSLKLGHVSLNQKFGAFEVREMREYVRMVFKESGLVENVMKHGIEVVVGTSGTIRAVEKAVFCGYGKDLNADDVGANDSGRDWKFSRGELGTVMEKLCMGGEEERVRRERFFKRRAEFIVAGAVLLDEIFEVLEIEEMEVSGYGLGEGVIAESLANVFEGYDMNANARWQSVLRLSSRFNGKKRIKSAEWCATIAKEIFKSLRNWMEVADAQDKPCIHFNEKDLECLEAACLLHNIGLFSGKKGYHKRSYSMIMDGDHLHGYSADEVKLIALLTRHHRKKFPNSDSDSLKNVPEPMKQKFKFLCAIIRLSILLQQNDGLSFKHVELLHSEQGFELAFREDGDQNTVNVAKDIYIGVRDELERLEMVIQQLQPCI